MIFENNFTNKITFYVYNNFKGHVGNCGSLHSTSGETST